MSLLEATIILGVLTLVTSVLALSINDFVQDAKQTKAREDIEIIGGSVMRMLKGTGETMVLATGAVVVGAGPSHAAGNRVTMLVSDGTIPIPAVPRGGLTNWDSVNGVPLPAVVQSIESQLVANSPAYRTPSDMSVLTNFDPPGGAGYKSEYGWRGAYLASPIGPDPWGRRYAINTEFLGSISGGAQTNFDDDVFVISAGPNGVVDTPFAGSATAPVGDDLMYVISGAAR